MHIARALLRFAACVMIVSGAAAQVSGPLRVDPANPRYFTDGSGKAILLAGSHTWHSVFEQGASDPPPHFDITQFCNFLKDNGHNFTRTFVWEQSRRGAWTSDTNYWFNPPPQFKRTGPGIASDGKPKWDLDSLNQSYFDWIRARVDTFNSRGIYVSIQLFDGWSVFQELGKPGNPWLDHPMRSMNNINGIDGNNSQAGPNGEATQSLLIPAIWPIQSRYIKKLLDELNSYDNVLYEVSNESWSGSQDWQFQVIDTVKAYESQKPKQHPIGMTVEYPGGDNIELFASHADWISVNEIATGGYNYKFNPPPSDGSKVILSDTDHLWGNGGDETWAWMSFTRGLNVLYMDGYDGKAYGTGHTWTSADSANPTVVTLRKNLGYILRYANRMNLEAMVPRTDLSATSYCLANPSAAVGEYLVYFPYGGTNNVNLSATPGVLNVEWFDPQTGVTTSAGTITGGASRSFTAPFAADAVLYVFAGPVTQPLPPVLASPVDGSNGVATDPTLSWNASTGATSYRLQVSTTSDFSSTAVNQSVATNSYAAVGLASNTLHFWRVNATNSGGTSAYSTVWSFTTTTPPAPPSVPMLATPADGATGVGTSPTLSWNASAGATTYHLQVSTDPGFGTTVVDLSAVTTNSTAVSSLASNTLYYWHVNATNGGGTSAYSVAWSFTTVTIPAGLVAAYAFDEGSGTTASDASGQGLTGTIVGATWSTSGKYGKALSFNGTSSYVNLGNPAQLQLTGSMTLSAWINAAANPADDGQIIAKSDNTSGWQLKTSPDTGPHTFGLAVSATSSAHAQRYSAAVRALNTWYHVAGVYDAGAKTLNIYVNGVLNNGTLSGAVPALQFNSSVGVNIGRRTGGWYFNGLIDEVRIYSRALTQAEIQTDMNTPLGAPPPPPAPPVLATPANGATGVATNPTLTWNASAGATTYHLQVSSDAGFGTTVVDQSNIATTSSAVSGLATDVTYYWRVDATNGGGTGAYSSVWSFRTIVARPDPPILALPANGAADQLLTLTLKWYASLGATSYRLQLAADSLFAVLVVDDSTLTDTLRQVGPLQNFTMYYWKVRAKNVGGTSAYSGSWNYRTVPPPPPAPPVLGTPANGATGVATSPTLTWNASVGATSYHLQVSSDAGFGTTVVDQNNIATTSSVVSGLAVNTLYYWHVSAANNGGSSAYSDAWGFTTTVPPPPPAPPVLATPANGATGVATNPTLTWNASAGATTYHLQVSSDAGFGTTVVDQSNIATTSSAVSGLATDVTYYWRVNATNGGGTGAYSSVWSFRTIVARPDPPILALPANGAADQLLTLTLKWYASLGATSYRLQLAADSLFAVLVVDDSTLTDTLRQVGPLQNFTMYYWKVRAKNVGGTSAYSGSWNYRTVPPPPPAPPILATPANGATGVATSPTLTWNASVGATSYHLQVSSDAGFGTTVVDQNNIATTSSVVSGLAVNTLYYWHVSAANNGGSSAYAGAWSFATVGIPAGLVAAYAFDEGSGTTVADASGHGLTGTISGATWTTQGKFNNALSFNGTSSYVNLANPTSLRLTGSMTLSAWAKAVANPAGDAQIISKSNSTAGWQLKTRLLSGSHTFGASVSTNNSSRTQRNSTTVRSLGTWYHVASVYNATARSLDIYVNGVLDNGALSGTVPASQYNANVNVNIGRQQTGSLYFNGVVDEVRIYNRALTQAEIQTDMNTPLGAPPAPPAAPVLATPANGSTGVVTNPTLTWNASVGATSYHLQVSTDPGFATTIVDQNNIGTTSSSVNGLLGSTPYYWHVSAANAGGPSAYSASWSFTTVAPPAVPVLATPVSGATGVATNPTLTWNASTGATTYHLQVSSDPGFATTIVDQNNISTTSSAVSGLGGNTLYYWHVSATNSGGSSLYSSAWSFTTAAPPPPPAVPVLATPTNGATAVVTNPTLTWNASTGATSYHVQVSTDPGFATTVVDQNNISTTSSAVSGLATNTLYYWHVSAANAGGPSSYSGAWSFTTVALPAGLVAAYAFDEGSGTTVTDASGHALTGTIVGATWTTSGKYGKALSFNGTSSYVDLANPASLQLTGSMTLSAWVNAAANPADDGQIIAKSDNTSGWQLKTSPDTGPQTFGVGVSPTSSTHAQRYSTTVRSLATWYHVAGVYNATTQTLDIYVNGVLNDGTLSGTVPVSQMNSSVNVNIGRRTGGYYFNGLIDEVRIYNRALTQAEIQTDMNTPLSTLIAAPASANVSVVAQEADINAAQGVGGKTVVPEQYVLEQNYPNPFNPSTTLRYAIPTEGHVTLQVFNILGEVVAALVDQDQLPGYYQTTFNSGRLASGMYIYRIQATGFVMSKKLLLIK